MINFLKPMSFENFVTMIVYYDEPDKWKIETIKRRIEVQRQARRTIKENDETNTMETV